MQTGGNLVRTVVELASSVELCHHDLDGAHLFLWVDIRRNATTVVGHANAVSRQNGNFNMVAETGEGFIDRVIDYFPY